MRGRELRRRERERTEGLSWRFAEKEKGEGVVLCVRRVQQRRGEEADGEREKMGLRGFPVRVEEEGEG